MAVADIVVGIFSSVCLFLSSVLPPDPTKNYLTKSKRRCLYQNMGSVSLYSLRFEMPLI